MNFIRSTWFLQEVDEDKSNILWEMGIDFQWYTACNSGRCNGSEIVLLNMWVPRLFWWNFSQPERGVLARNDSHIQFPCHLSYFKCIVGSDGTIFWVVLGRYKWWVFSTILKMDFGFRLSWMRRNQRSTPLVSYRINRHSINLDGGIPTPNVAEGAVLVQPRLIDVFADFIWNGLVVSTIASREIS